MASKSGGRRRDRGPGPGNDLAASQQPRFETASGRAGTLPESVLAAPSDSPVRPAESPETGSSRKGDPLERPEDLFIEPDGGNRESVRRLGYRFIDLLVDASSEAGTRPPLDRASLIPASPYQPSEAGRDTGELLAEVDSFMRRGMNPAHPGFMGHMDTIASAIGIFSDAVVSALNNNMLAWEMSPVFSELEQKIMRWACSLFGLGATDDHPDRRPIGHLVSGGTLANITAMWVARNARGGDALADHGLSGRRTPVFLASENAHFSFRKAANILGLGRDGWVEIPADAEGRVLVDRMEQAIRRVRDEGRVPFALVGVAGTTITGSIDPLPEIAALARREGLWFHVDAAYGGAIAFSETLRPKLRGIEHADSVTFNPQKWLFVPKTCATLLFRDRREPDRHLREPFIYGASNRTTAGRERTNLGEWTLQGTRRVDVLKLFLTLEHFGRARLARMIERQVDLARVFAGAIADCPELELLHRPELNIVCFRYRGHPAWPEWIDDDAPLDRLNTRIQERLEESGIGWLSLPHYRRRTILRAVILHPRTTEALLDRILDQVREAGREILRQR